VLTAGASHGWDAHYSSRSCKLSALPLSSPVDDRCFLSSIFYSVFVMLILPIGIAAYPESVNVLDGISGDVRTPDKLLTNNDDSDSMWLAPILPSVVCVSYLSSHTLVLSD